MSRLWPRLVEACSVWNATKLEDFYCFFFHRCGSLIEQKIFQVFLLDFLLSSETIPIMWTRVKQRKIAYHSRVPPVQEFVDSLGEEEYEAVDGEHGQDDGGESDRGQGLPHHVIACNC